MVLHNVTRSSDSSWVSSVWTSRSDEVVEMTAVASETWGLVFWEHEGRRYAAITGPESQASTAPVPPDCEFIGIQLAVGTSLRAQPMPSLVDSGIELADVTARGFYFDGGRWEIPSMDDAEALVARLVRDEVLVRDPVVTATLDGRDPFASDRTVERRFRAATGLTRGAVDQIRRVRAAAELLAAGTDVATVVAQFDYYDEPHLARALRRYVGRTAGQLKAGDGGAIALAHHQQ